MKRDFSESSKQELLRMVNAVESEKWSSFTDWVGDRWLDFESVIGSLGIRNYINNVNTYHKKVIDKNNATEESINKIFAEVNAVDDSYGTSFRNVRENLNQWLDYVKALEQIVSPGTGRFTPSYMEGRLNNLLKEISKSNIQRILDTMIRNLNGELIFDETVMYEYIKMDPGKITDDELGALLQAMAKLKDTVATYETLATFGDDKLGADIWTKISWLAEDTKYESFTAVSMHYNKIYVNLLNKITELSEDMKTVAGSIVRICNGESSLDVLGFDYSKEVGKLFGDASFAAYALKYVSAHSEQYFLKLEASEKNSWNAFGKLKPLEEHTKKLKNKFNDMAEDKGWRESEKITEYYDKDGNLIKEKDAPEFYKKEMTILETKKDWNASVSIYDGEFTNDLGGGGKVDVTVGEAEAHAAVSGGLYMINAKGDKQFMPGVQAEIGASVTAAKAEWEQQWLGDENFGLNTEVGVTAGKAGVGGQLGAQLYDKDGKLNVQLGGKLEAEAIAAEVEGSVGVNVLGGEVGVKGGVNFGVGAHADVGYKDGVFKCDIGASLGVGLSLDVEVDVGGMVETVADTATAAWDGIKDGWNDFWSW